MTKEIKTELLTLYRNEIAFETEKEKAYQGEAPNPHTKNIETLNRIISKLETL